MNAEDITYPRKFMYSYNVEVASLLEKLPDDVKVDPIWEQLHGLGLGVLKDNLGPMIAYYLESDFQGGWDIIVVRPRPWSGEDVILVLATHCESLVALGAKSSLETKVEELKHVMDTRDRCIPKATLKFYIVLQEIMTCIPENGPITYANYDPSMDIVDVQNSFRKGIRIVRSLVSRCTEEFKNLIEKNYNYNSNSSKASDANVRVTQNTSTAPVASVERPGSNIKDFSGSTKKNKKSPIVKDEEYDDGWNTSTMGWGNKNTKSTEPGNWENMDICENEEETRKPSHTESGQFGVNSGNLTWKDIEALPKDNDHPSWDEFYKDTGLNQDDDDDDVPRKDGKNEVEEEMSGSEIEMSSHHTDELVDDILKDLIDDTEEEQHRKGNKKGECHNVNINIKSSHSHQKMNTTTQMVDLTKDNVETLESERERYSFGDGFEKRFTPKQNEMDRSTTTEDDSASQSMNRYTTEEVGMRNRDEKIHSKKPEHEAKKSVNVWKRESDNGEAPSPAEDLEKNFSDLFQKSLTVSSKSKEHHKYSVDGNVSHNPSQNSNTKVVGSFIEANAATHQNVQPQTLNLTKQQQPQQITPPTVLPGLPPGIQKPPGFEKPQISTNTDLNSSSSSSANPKVPPGMHQVTTHSNTTNTADFMYQQNKPISPPPGMNQPYTTTTTTNINTSSANNTESISLPPGILPLTRTTAAPPPGYNAITMSSNTSNASTSTTTALPPPGHNYAPNMPQPQQKPLKNTYDCTNVYGRPLPPPMSSKPLDKEDAKVLEEIDKRIAADPKTQKKALQFSPPIDPNVPKKSTESVTDSEPSEINNSMSNSLTNKSKKRLVNTDPIKNFLNLPGNNNNAPVEGKMIDNNSVASSSGGSGQHWKKMATTSTNTTTNTTNANAYNNPRFEEFLKNQEMKRRGLKDPSSNPNMNTNSNVVTQHGRMMDTEMKDAGTSYQKSGPSTSESTFNQDKDGAEGNHPVHYEKKFKQTLIVPSIAMANEAASINISQQQRQQQQRQQSQEQQQQQQQQGKKLTWPKLEKYADTSNGYAWGDHWL